MLQGYCLENKPECQFEVSKGVLFPWNMKIGRL